MEEEGRAHGWLPWLALVLVLGLAGGIEQFYAFRLDRLKSETARVWKQVDAEQRSQTGLLAERVARLELAQRDLAWLDEQKARQAALLEELGPSLKSLSWNLGTQRLELVDDNPQQAMGRLGKLPFLHELELDRARIGARWGR